MGAPRVDMTRGAFAYDGAMPDEMSPAPMQLSIAFWPADTEITLARVRWDASYNAVVNFGSVKAASDYIDSLPTERKKVYGDSTYHRADQPIYLEDPYNTVINYNYVRVRQPGQPVEGGEDERVFFYFIVGVEHISPNVTAVQLQLDVWTSYYPRTVMGMCFVERGHVGVANADAFRNGGRDYLTVPEGLDTGSRMRTVQWTHKPIMNARFQGSNESPGAQFGHVYLIRTTMDFEADWGSQDNPNLDTAKPSLVFGIYQGIGTYFATQQGLITLLNRLSTRSWIAQGVIEIMAVPDPRDYGAQNLGTPVGGPNDLSGVYIAPSILIPQRTHVIASARWYEAWHIRNYIGNKYRNLKKFFTSPYTIIELSSSGGNSLVLSPEQFDTSNGRAMSIYTTVAYQIGAATAKAHPLRYGYAADAATAQEWDATLFTETGDMPRIGTVNDNAALALASSVHTRAFGPQSASWARQKAQRGSDAAYQAASGAMDLAQQQSDISAQYQTAVNAQNAEWANEDAFKSYATKTAMGGAAGVVAGPAGALLGAGAGAIAGGIDMYNTYVQNRRNNESLAMSLANQQNMLDANLNNAGANRDRNKALADFASNGDYQMAIKAQQASVQDTELTAPSVVAMGGGSLTDMFTKGELVHRVRIKMPEKNTIRQIGDFWLRYGYAINEYMRPPQSLSCMEKFTYWKMKDVNITANPMPEYIKNAIRGILERGVTVWNDPDYIAVTELDDNEPIERAYY